MLHELLCILGGYPGGTLERVNRGANGMSEVADFVHPGEEAVIKKILETASEYQQLKSFVEKYAHDSRVFKPLLKEGTQNASKPLPAGLYLKAFAMGIDNALSPYRDELVDIEDRVLADPHCSIIYLQTRVKPYEALFPVLNSLINQVITQKLHGCQLLQLLYESLIGALGKVRAALEKILLRCHNAFFKQLSTWLLHGVLNDSFCEFFIQPIKKASGNPQTRSYIEYEVSPDLLPRHIPLSLANKILFIGQSIVMISNDPRDRNTDASSTLILDKSDVNDVVWNQCGQRYLESLRKLDQSTLLDIQILDGTIEIIRGFITEQLWELAVEQAQLPIQMRLIKDMFLLGRGELFLEFIKEAGSILDKAPSSKFHIDINKAFRIAKHRILVGNEESKLDQFYFSGLHDSTSGINDVDNGWTALVLQYKVSWPLHLLFTPDILECYNQLFGFLLKVKKTQRQLHQLWTFQMMKKYQRWQDSRISKIRSWLMFIVDHLQYYLQVDVLESQWTILENALNSSRDFEALRHAHTNFLASTLSQTFLLLGSAKNEPSTTSYQKPESLKNNPVHNSLSALLRLCEKFCDSVSSWEGLEPSIHQEDELNQLCRELDQLVNCLLQLLSSLKALPCGTHLAQLLLRLDFNRWFSRQCTGSSLTGSLTGSIC